MNLSKLENFSITCKVCGSEDVYLTTYMEYDDWYAKLECANCDNEESE